MRQTHEGSEQRRPKTAEGSEGEGNGVHFFNSRERKTGDASTQRARDSRQLFVLACASMSFALGAVRSVPPRAPLGGLTGRDVPVGPSAVLEA